MSPWTCPNTECEYNKQLQPKQRCPLCNETAQEFKSEDFGSLLEAKRNFKRLKGNRKKHKRDLEKAKYCPKCGSPEVNFLVYYSPSIWKCLNCGYEGIFVVEGNEFAAKIRKRYLETDEKTT